MSGHTHTHTHTYTHTYTHDNYYNPRCAHAHRGLIIMNINIGNDIFDNRIKVQHIIILVNIEFKNKYYFNKCNDSWS